MSARFWKALTFSCSGALVIGLFIFGWMSCGPARSGIYDFDPARDSEPLIKTMEQDIFWLFVEPADWGTNWDVHYMINTRSPNTDPRYFGQLIIKVMRDHGKFAGFVTYHKLKFNEGRVQFLSVPKEFRGKGYGKKLLSYAIHDLFEQGCSRVILLTRTTNVWAQRIYAAVGFKEANRHDNGLVDYVILKP